MNYTQKLTLSMLVPTFMVAGAGSTVALGAWWLQRQSHQVDIEVMAGYLVMGGALTAVLTTICVATCVGFTIWIRRTARQVLGGEPSTASDVLAALADGNLSVEVPVAHEGSLLHSLQRLVDSLQIALGDIQQASQSIAQTSSEIASGNKDLSDRTERTAGNLQQTASSLEMLTSKVRESTEAARKASLLVASASEVAHQGGEVVGQVVQTMDEINHSSQRIRDIISVIDGISFQTNILALNAAVEAARTGEQGRGFAVVAGEVRSLAGRSAEAAREIKDLIETSVARVQSGSELVQAAGTTMRDIVGSVQRVSETIASITTASSEQSNGLGEINSEIGLLDQMTQQNAALVEQAAAATGGLREQAHRLDKAVQMFRV